MTVGEGRHRAVELSQDLAYQDGHNYTVGSPHLRHTKLRVRIESRIESAISEILQRQDECVVLEIGAGHGFFTDTVLAAGGTATVTEMSRASFDYLAERYRDVPGVRVVHDIDGSAPFNAETQYDVILLISVIHHIPDYLDVVTKLCDYVLRPGGSLVTFQDPVWYPRQRSWERGLTWGSYFAWRLTQGDLRRGLATRWRRLRGVYSESEPADLVEYHVVRHGVDDMALLDLFRARFAKVEMDRYFSTQSPQLQMVFEKWVPPNTFGIVARNHIASGDGLRLGK